LHSPRLAAGKFLIHHLLETQDHGFLIEGRGYNEADLSRFAPKKELLSGGIGWRGMQMVTRTLPLPNVAYFLARDNHLKSNHNFRYALSMTGNRPNGRLGTIEAKIEDIFRRPRFFHSGITTEIRLVMTGRFQSGSAVGSSMEHFGQNEGNGLIFT
jgi:hypothetical protein